MWIAIVDMDQLGRRVPVIITDDDDEQAIFETCEEIFDLQRDHPLGKFHWWAFNFATGEVEP